MGNEAYSNSKDPIKIFDDALFIAASRSHSAAIKSDNSLYTWGSNIDFRLGLEERRNFNVPTNTKYKVVKVSLGTTHSGFITVEGKTLLTGNGQ